MISTAVKKKVKNKMPLFDQRMLEFMDFVLANNVHGVSTKAAFFQSLGASNAANLVQIQKGEGRSFTMENVLAAKAYYGIDTNFFFDANHLQIYPVSKPQSPLLQLRAAVAAVALELRGN